MQWLRKNTGTLTDHSFAESNYFPQLYIVKDATNLVYKDIRMLGSRLHFYC